MTTIYPVIMCGGAGTRLWPLSTKAKPKQFHALVTENSMLQDTISRAEFAADLDVARPSFVCALDHEVLIRDQCRALGVEPLSIIFEPCARNTAPVAAAIALEISRIDPEGLVLLLPADHYIEAPGAFWQAVQKGMSAAQSGHITTFGIMPTHPETGYGYIQGGQTLSDQCVAVEAFVEKPDKPTAETYLETGKYFWNAGIFLFSPQVMIDAFSAHAPDILKSTQQTIAASKRAAGSLYLDSQTFSACRSDSIDYAIMENSDNVAMVCPVDIGWTDLGSWDAIQDFMNLHKPNAPSTGPVMTLDCTNSLVLSDGPFIAAIGLKDIIVVATKDSILITDSAQTQSVKTIVQSLKDAKKPELL